MFRGLESSSLDLAKQNSAEALSHKGNLRMLCEMESTSLLVMELSDCREHCNFYTQPNQIYFNKYTYNKDVNLNYKLYDSEIGEVEEEKHEQRKLDHHSNIYQKQSSC